MKDKYQLQKGWKGNIYFHFPVAPFHVKLVHQISIIIGAVHISLLQIARFILFLHKKYSVKVSESNMFCNLDFLILVLASIHLNPVSCSPQPKVTDGWTNNYNCSVPPVNDELVHFILVIDLVVLTVIAVIIIIIVICKTFYCRGFAWKYSV